MARRRSTEGNRVIQQLAQQLVDQLARLPEAEKVRLTNELPELVSLAQTFHLPPSDQRIFPGSKDLDGAILDSITDGVISIDWDWNIRYINPRAAQHGRLAPGEQIGKNLWAAFPNLAGTPLEAQYRQVMENREPVQFEMQGVSPDLPYYACVYPSECGITVYWLDNDPHTRMEGEFHRVLRENQRQAALLEAIFAADPGGIAVLVGRELRFAYANPAYRYIIPNPMQDPVGQPYDAVWPTKSRYANRDRFREVLRTGQPFQMGGIEYTFLDGTRRMFTLQARRIEWEDQLAVLLLMWDVTDLKKAEEELRSVALFPEQNPEPILRISLDGRLMYTNPAGRTLIPDFLTGQPAPAFWQELVQEAQQTGDPRIVDYQQAGRMYALHVVPLPDRGYVNLYGRDITERRSASEAVRQANARLRSVLGSITELYAVFDRGWRIVDLNRTAEQHFFPGQLPGAMLGRNMWEVLPEAVGGELYHALHHAMETGQPAHFEAGSRITEKWYEVHAYPRDDQLELYMHDVSERHQAVDALRESAARLKRAEEIAHLGSWELDLTTNQLTWSDEIYRIFGLRPQEFGATFKAFLDAVHPDDRAAVDGAYSGSLREGRDSYEIVHRVVQRSSGEVRVVHEKCEHIRDSSGQIIRSIGMVQDITERKIADQALRHSEEKFRTLFNSVGEGFTLNRAIYDDHGTLVDLLVEEANPAAEAANGLAREDFVGKTWRQLWPGAEAYWWEVCNPVIQDGKEVVYENYAAVHDRWYQVRHFSAGKDLLGSIFLDITERKRSEERIQQLNQELALRNAELEVERERWQGVVEGIADEIWVCDLQGKMSLMNLPSMTAMGLAEFAGKTYQEVLDEVDILSMDGQFRPVEHAPLLRALRGEIVRGEEIMRHRQTGRTRYRHFSAAPMRDATGAVTGSVAIVRDITNLMDAQAAAHARAIQIELQHRLLEQREQERLQIARDLHDGPLQELTGAAFILHGIEQDQCTPEIAQKLGALQTTLQEQITELRDYAGELRPPALAKFGLEKALQSHLEAFQEKNPGIHVRFDGSQAGAALPEGIGLALFRICQEALTNAAKHAQATEISIQLAITPGQVRLEIQDNGRGFGVPADWIELARQGHLGLVGMRERAEAVGGQLEINSKLGKNTRLVVVVPLAKTPD